MKDLILYGDCKDTLKQFKCKARTCITSPPYYGLRNYGDESKQIGLEDTPEEYIQNLVDVFREVRNVLTDDGTLWLNIGDSYYNYRPGKGQGLVKQTVSNTNQDLPNKCARRGNKLEGLKEKDLIGIPWMLAFALRADGWYLRQDIIWHKPNPMPESVKDRCTKSHEYIFLLSLKPKYYFDYEAIQEPAVYAGDNRSARKDSRRDQPFNSHMAATSQPVKEFRNKRDVWSINTAQSGEAHFAVFPEKIPELCIKAGTREGDLVLDPFMGSGTTATVAKRLGRNWVGIELNEEYAKFINTKTAQEELF